MKLELALGDITGEIASRVDAIVNAANSRLLGGGGVDGAIHRVGGPEILDACKHLRATSLPDGLPAGEAVATTAGRLPCRWVIHTVGPTFAKTIDKSATLESCYRRSLEVPVDVGARSVAFPLISAGIFRWPKADAISRALSVITASDADVDLAILVLYDRTTHELAESLLRV